MNTNKYIQLTMTKNKPIMNHRTETGQMTMFTKTSTHIKLQKKYLSLQRDFIDLNSRYQKLINKWNDLIDEINEKGGQSFMDSKTEKHNLTDDDIKKLLTLCHPDKHGGKSIANDMTAKLNNLRDKK